MLADADDGDILDFARRWGPLGYDITTSDLRQKPPYLAREPLSWIREHAQTISVCLRLLDYLSNADKDGLARYLRSVSAGFSEGSLGAIVGSFYAAAGGVLAVTIARRKRVTIESGPWSEDWPEGSAKLIIERVVNDALLGQAFGYPMIPTIAAHKKGFALVQRFGSLLQIVYFHLARLAASGEFAVGVCLAEDCGRFFVQEHAKQRFCTMRCAARERMRRFRRRKRLQVNPAEGEWPNGTH